MTQSTVEVRPSRSAALQHLNYGFMVWVLLFMVKSGLIDDEGRLRKKYGGEAP